PLQAVRVDDLPVEDDARGEADPLEQRRAVGQVERHRPELVANVPREEEAQLLAVEPRADLPGRLLESERENLGHQTASSNPSCARLSPAVLVDSTPEVTGSPRKSSTERSTIASAKLVKAT